MQRLSSHVWMTGLILITFYKNINDKMFTSAVSENGAVWMNSLLFPLNWHLFASVLVASVNPALGGLSTFCKVSYPVYLWTEYTYWLVPPDTVGWSHTFHWLYFVCFLFSIQFLIFYLNLLKDTGRKDSGPIGLVLAPSFASLSAESFCLIPLCPDTRIMVT